MIAEVENLLTVHTKQGSTAPGLETFSWSQQCQGDSSFQEEGC